MFSLVTWSRSTDKQAELDIPRIGRLHVERSNIHRIYRWRGSADLVYLGPNGLTGWSETVPPRARWRRQRECVRASGRPIRREALSPKQGWHEESGQLVTDREGASIQGNFGIPAQATIEFEISWKTKPDFVFALGIDDKDKGTVKRAFRFEAWGGDLVIQRELENEADLAVVQEISPGPGRAHLQAYLDQEARPDPGLLSGRQTIGELEGRRSELARPSRASTWRTCAATFGWNG